MIESLFIFSVTYLLLNAASYDGEIWHAHAWRPCAGLLLGFMSIGVIVTKKWHFPTKYLKVGQQICTAAAGTLCPRPRATCIDCSRWQTGWPACYHHRSPTQTQAMAWCSRSMIDWLSMVLRLRQHNIGYTTDGFYRAMHFSAKRGIAIACRLSVSPSVCNVGGLWSHRLEFFEINFTVS